MRKGFGLLLRLMLCSWRIQNWLLRMMSRRRQRHSVRSVDTTDNPHAAHDLRLFEE